LTLDVPVLSILVYSGIVLLPVLLPVAGTDRGLELTAAAGIRPKNDDKNNSAPELPEIQRLALSNIQEGSMRLWAFLLSVYWVSFVTYFVLWKSYKHVSNLRATARSTPDVKPEEFAVLVRDVPRSYPDETIKDSVDSYFRALHPNTFYRSMVVTDHTKVLLFLKCYPL
jgi:hypothetical protein